MKRHKLYIRTISMIFVVCLLLCGCQQSPENDIIVNPDSTGVKEGDYTKQNADSNGSTTIINESFDSTDGSVHFELDFQTDSSVSSLPTVVVEPHYFSEEDAKRVANVLFGNAEFYEREPYASATFSKSEIQERLERWSQYVNNEALSELYGTDDISYIQGLVQEYILKYTLKQETVSDGNVHTICEWKFKEESRYTFSEDNITQEELDNDNSAIMVNCSVNGINYCLDIVTRNKSDYKLNVITAYIDGSNSPFGIDEAIARANLCRTEKPNQTQIDAILKKTEYILNAIDLGQWAIDSYVLQEGIIGEQVEYIIQINALPVLEGAKATDCSSFFESKENSYASNYYLSNVKMEFAPDGTLLSFELTSPIDILEVSGQTEVTSTIDTMIERAKEILSLSDWNAFYTSTSKDLSKESVVCNVSITQGYFGLVRTKVKDQDNQYQYIPAFILTGTYELTNFETGKMYMYKDSPGIILALNVSNGAIIVSPGA
ncbi:MAG: DUF6034 family protein [Oscillospiraceae bacterium]|nr:DUF6034 family protein [Oscillospiraceae bacterium]